MYHIFLSQFETNKLHMDSHTNQKSILNVDLKHPKITPLAIVRVVSKKK